MTIGEAKRRLRKELNSTNAGQEAVWMLETLLQLDSGGLLAAEGKELTEEQWRVLQDWLRRRRAGEPLQYILGEWSFMGLSLDVRRGVLIPREDSETLVRAALAFMGQDSGYAVLDLCTGSGAIAIAIAKYAREASVVAVDINPEACKLARKNACKNGVKLEVRQADVLDESFWRDERLERRYHVITANPPYIASDEMSSLDDGVRLYEPPLALHGGEDGLDFYRVIAEKAALLLRAEGALFLEIGHRQGKDVAGLLGAQGWRDIQIGQDENGRDRLVVARL